MRNHICSFAMLLLATSSVRADDAGLPLDDSESCLNGPLAQFGRYLGRWDIEDRRLSRDGKEWTDGGGARWDFVCIGHGTAIQDFWMPNDGDIGTNLRTWNSKTASWDIAWAIRSQPGFAHIRAQQQADGRIVMHYQSPVPDPLRRITFFPPDAGGWNWTLEFSFDSGENWTEVYRIRATPHDR